MLGSHSIGLKRQMEFLTEERNEIYPAVMSASLTPFESWEFSKKRRMARRADEKRQARV